MLSTINHYILSGASVVLYVKLDLKLNVFTNLSYLIDRLCTSSVVYWDWFAWHSLPARIVSP